jgi:hypothetical protein
MTLLLRNCGARGATEFRQFTGCSAHCTREHDTQFTDALPFCHIDVSADINSTGLQHRRLVGVSLVVVSTVREMSTVVFIPLAGAAGALQAYRSGWWLPRRAQSAIAEGVCGLEEARRGAELNSTCRCARPQTTNTHIDMTRIDVTGL